MLRNFISRQPQPQSRRSLNVERLETRQLLTVLLVNSPLDNVVSGDGQVTLREAIIAANTDSPTDLGNAGSGADKIKFDLGPGNHTITLDGSLGELSITDDLTIKGLGADRLSISGGNATRVFSVSGSETDVKISHVTIADGV